jgi:hypothetical protein
MLQPTSTITSRPQRPGMPFSGPARNGDAVLVSHEAIARRAHEIFLERGASHGHDREDWLTAESELKASTGRW